jgi:hypothetical protein
MNLTQTLMTAAVSGILVGLSACSGTPAPVAPQGSKAAPTATSDVMGMSDSAASSDAESLAKHECKGQNACKGQGGCKTDKNACHGRNTCKGQGGCKV